MENKFSKLASKASKTSLLPVKRNHMSKSPQKLLFFVVLLQILLQDLMNVNCSRSSTVDANKNSSNDYRSNKNKLNIAIIGSGIGGLSTAYYLKKNKLLNINKIDIFEKNARVGGRVYSESIFNRTENLGASFFIHKNKLISSLIEELKLKIFSTSASNSDNSFGLFNNKTIFFSLGNSKFVNIIKMFWRYGLSIIREKILMKKNLEKFAKIYQALDNRVIFSDVRQLINHMGLEDLVTQSIKDFLLERYVDEQYTDEFANLLLKIIYNQQNDINAFAGFITLIGGSYESFRVEGGNYQIVKKLEEALSENIIDKNKTFADDWDVDSRNSEQKHERILFENEAKVEIMKNTNVLRILKKFYVNKEKQEKEQIRTKHGHEADADETETEFKATDFFYTVEYQKKPYFNLNNSKSNSSFSDDKIYKNKEFNSTKFNDNKNDFDYINVNNDENTNLKDEVFFEDYDIVILAAPLEYSKIQFPSDIDLNNTNLLPKKNYYYFIKGKLRNDLFNDFEANELPGMLISYNKTLSNNILYIKQLNDNFHKDEFKVNSDEVLSQKDIEKYFDSNYTIKYINHWEMAYPQLLPRKLETLPSFQLSENLFYLNAIESVGSCMELSMISAKNIVNLIENRFFPFKQSNHFKTEEF